MWTNRAAVDCDLSYWDTAYCPNGANLVYHPCGWCGDVFLLTNLAFCVKYIPVPSLWMVKGEVMADTEKITINMNAVELGKIDLLVEQGHYSNRTDFIRSAIRSQLEKHAVEVQQTVVRSSYAVGVIFYDRVAFEEHRARGEKVKVNVVGMFQLTNDVFPSLAVEVIDSIKVYGIFQASSEVKEALTKAGKVL